MKKYRLIAGKAGPRLIKVWYLNISQNVLVRLPDGTRKNLLVTSCGTKTFWARGREGWEDVDYHLHASSIVDAFGPNVRRAVA